MENLSSIFDSLYKDFLLRDFFAKIVPGSLLMGTLFYISGVGFKSYASLISTGWWFGILVLGVFWILGYALQTMGEILRIIQHHPKAFNSVDIRYELRRKFQKKAQRNDSNRAERYAIIKEATGNFSIALFVASSLLIGQQLINNPTSKNTSIWVMSIAGLIIALLLTISNRSHAKKQYAYMQHIVDQMDESETL